MTKSLIPPISVKSSKTSLQNALLLLIFVIGMFMLYRYTKSIDDEVKIIHNNIIELNEKFNNLGTISNEKDEECNTKSRKMVMEGGNGKVFAPRSVDKPGKTDDENDDSSVKSEDITNMLRKVIGGDGDIEMFEADETEAINVMNKIFSNVIQPSIPTTNQEEDDFPKCTVTDVEDDETVCSKQKNVLNLDDNSEECVEGSMNQSVASSSGDGLSKIDLMKKTNEELKTLLKEKNLSVKGAKNELVERLLTT